MQIAGFEFRPSLYPSIAFAMLFPALLGLGFWQMGRAVDKQDLLDQRAAHDRVQPLRLERGVSLAPGDRFRPAAAAGRYLPERHWLLDNRVYRGQVGYHVYTLFARDGGGPLLLVNRGWVELGPTRDLLPDVDPPAGPVQLRGRLDRPEAVALELDSGELAGIAPVKVVQHLDPAELALALGRELLPLVLVLDEGQPGLFRRDWQAATTMTPEKHLGYAVQWFGLAVALLIIYLGVNTRRARELPDDRPAAS